jgi:DNA-binding IscR family transcriptional regulator
MRQARDAVAEILESCSLAQLAGDAETGAVAKQLDALAL